MPPSLATFDSAVHGLLRLRFAGTLHLPTLLLHPQGFERYLALHPRHRFPDQLSLVIGHTPVGYPVLRSALAEGLHPCLDVWLCCAQDNPGVQGLALLPSDVEAWLMDSQAFRHDQSRQQVLASELMPLHV